MATGGSVVIDYTANKIAAYAASQRWYQKNANFVTSVGGLAATILAWVATQPFAEDPRVQVLVVFAGFVLTSLGVRMTPNGWSASQLRKLAEFGQSVPTSLPMTVNTTSVDSIGAELDSYNKRTFGPPQ